MSTNTAAALRIATAISTFKWIAVGGILLVGLIGLVGSSAAGDGGGGAFVGLLFLLGAVLYALVAWVLFGWFEQTLRLLAAIATNTAPPVAHGTPPQGWGSSPAPYGT